MKVLLILLGILKWIGIALLALLLFILLLLLVILLSPIRYRLMGQKQESIGGSFDVSWLFGAVKVKGSYSSLEKGDLSVKVLWFTLVDTEKKRAEEDQKPAEKQPPQKETAQKEKPKQEPVLQTAEKQPEEEVPKRPKEKPQQQRMAEKQPKTVQRVQLSEIEERPPEETDESKEDFFSGEPKEKEQKERTSVLEVIWSIEQKKEIFLALKKLLKRLIGGILPGDLFFKASIGTGDPSATGYVLAAAGVLTAKFGDDIQVKGDFTKAALEDAELRLKGKIVLGALLWAVLVFVLTKPVRKALREMIKFFRVKAK